MKKKNLLVVAAIAGLLSGPALADKKSETKTTETKTEKTCTDKDGKTIACDDAAKTGNGCGANGCSAAATTKTETKTETKKK